MSTAAVGFFEGDPLCPQGGQGRKQPPRMAGPTVYHVTVRIFDKATKKPLVIGFLQQQPFGMGGQDGAEQGLARSGQPRDLEQPVAQFGSRWKGRPAVTIGRPFLRLLQADLGGQPTYCRKDSWVHGPSETGDT